MTTEPSIIRKLAEYQSKYFGSTPLEKKQVEAPFDPLGSKVPENRKNGS